MSAHNVRNLISIFQAAKPEGIEAAKASYWRYHDILEAIALPLGYSMRRAAGVFAALSPNSHYLGNLKGARDMLRAAKAGKEIEDFKVNTYDHNKEKAWRIAKGWGAPSDEITANKTRAFFYNILTPNDPEHVTVDGHIYWAWFGRRGRLAGKRDNDGLPVAPSISDDLYSEISEAVRIVSDIGRLIPNQAQAVIWQTYRRIHNIQSSRQTELIASDAIIAGLEADHPLSRSGCGR
jgi:hypothetical protein